MKRLPVGKNGTILLPDGTVTTIKAPTGNCVNVYHGGMHGGDYMVPGDCIISQDNSVYLSFQRTDGNVVLYNHSNNAVIWSSYKTGGTEFIQQGDGNLVEYNGSTALWASNVNSSCPANGTYLTLVYLDMNQ